MSKVLGFKKWRVLESDSNKLFEGDEKKGGKKALLVGATNHKAYNKSAGKKVNSDTPITISEVETLSDEKSISRKVGTSIKEFIVSEKTESGRDYLKIGDITLNGDEGNVEQIKVSFREFLKNDIEAAGNGIYALGRAIKYWRKYKLSQGDPLHIVLNQPSPTPVVMFASSKKALADPMPSWRGMIHYIAVAGVTDRTNIVQPAKSNIESDYFTKRYMKRTHEQAITSANMFPTPRIDAETKAERLDLRVDMQSNSTKFEIAQFLENNSGKRIKDKKLAVKLIREFSKKYYKQFVDTQVDRYNYYIGSISKKAGVDSSLFSEITAEGEAWRQKWLGKEDYFASTAARQVEQLFASVSYTTGTRPGGGANAGSTDLEIGGF